MSKTLNFLKTFLPKLNSLIDSELRIEGSSKFVKSTYICGYSKILDISIFIKIVNEGKILYKIEHLGHTLLEKICDDSDQTMESFIYILEDFIQSSMRLKNQLRKFPNLTDEDRRDFFLSKLFEEDSNVTPVP
jgi:hypothetical protein